MNIALESKDATITQLTSDLMDLRQSSQRLADEMVRLQKELEVAKLDAADAISAFASTGNSSGTFEGESNELRDSLEEIQEELVAVSERCETLEESIKMYKCKISIYEKLVDEYSKALDPQLPSYSDDLSVISVDSPTHVESELILTEESMRILTNLSKNIKTAIIKVRYMLYYGVID
jgi:chromosome segregation ATPase